MYGKHPQGVRAPFFPGGAPPPPSQKAPPPPPLPGGGAMLGMGHSPSESPGISLDLSARVEGGSVGVSGSPTQQQQNQDTLSSWPRRAYGGKVASFLETRDRCMVVEIPRAEGNDGRWGPAVWCSLRTLREKTPADTPALAFVFHHQAAPPRFLELEAEREGFKLLSWKAWQRMRRLNPSMWPQNMLVVKHLVATDIEDPSFHTSVDASYALVLVNFRECLTHLNYQAPGVALHPYLGLLEFLAAASSGFAALHLSVIGLEDESFSSSLWQTHAGTMQGNYNFDFFFFKDLFDLREKVYIPESEDKADAFGPLCALIEEAALSMFPSRSELFGRSPMLPTFGGDRPSFSTSPPLMFTKWLVVCKSRQEAHEVYQRLARRGPEDAQSSGGRAWWKERVHMIHDVPTGTSVKLDDNWEVLVVHAEVARKSGMAGLMLSLYNRVSLIVHFDVPPSESPLADFVCLHVPAAPLSTSNRTKLEILLAPASRVPVCCNGTLLVDLLGRSSLPRELIEKIFEMDPGLYDVPRPRTIMGAPVLPPQQQQQPGAGVSCSKEALQMELKELDCVPLDPQQQPLLGDAPAPHQQQNGPGKKGKLQQRPSLSNSDADGSAPPTGKGRRLWWFSTPTDSSVLEPPPLADLPAQSKKAKAKDKDKVQTEKEKEKEKERERAEKEREKEREEAAAFRVVPQPSGCPDLRYEGEPMGPDALHGGVGQDRRADKPAAPCLYRMKKRWPKFLHIVRASFRIREDSSESECFEPPSEREPEQTSNSGGEPQGNGEAESKENEEKDRDSTNGAAGAAATLLGVPQTFEDFGWISVQRGLERTGLGLHYNRQLRGSKKDGVAYLEPTCIRWPPPYLNPRYAPAHGHGAGGRGGMDRERDRYGGWTAEVLEKTQQDILRFHCTFLEFLLLDFRRRWDKVSGSRSIEEIIDTCSPATSLVVPLISEKSFTNRSLGVPAVSTGAATAPSPTSASAGPAAHSQAAPLFPKASPIRIDFELVNRWLDFVDALAVCRRKGVPMIPGMPPPSRGTQAQADRSGGASASSSVPSSSSSSSAGGSSNPLEAMIDEKVLQGLEEEFANLEMPEEGEGESNQGGSGGAVRERDLENGEGEGGRSERGGQAASLTDDASKTEVAQTAGKEGDGEEGQRDKTVPSSAAPSVPQSPIAAKAEQGGEEKQKEENAEQASHEDDGTKEGIGEGEREKAAPSVEAVEEKGTKGEEDVEISDQPQEGDAPASSSPSSSSASASASASVAPAAEGTEEPGGKEEGQRPNGVAAAVSKGKEEKEKTSAEEEGGSPSPHPLGDGEGGGPDVPLPSAESAAASGPVETGGEEANPAPSVSAAADEKTEGGTEEKEKGEPGDLKEGGEEQKEQRQQKEKEKEASGVGGDKPVSLSSTALEGEREADGEGEGDDTGEEILVQRRNSARAADSDGTKPAGTDIAGGLLPSASVSVSVSVEVEVEVEGEGEEKLHEAESGKKAKKKKKRALKGAEKKQEKELLKERQEAEKARALAREQFREKERERIMALRMERLAETLETLPSICDLQAKFGQVVVTHCERLPRVYFVRKPSGPSPSPATQRAAAAAAERSGRPSLSSPALAGGESATEGSPAPVLGGQKEGPAGLSASSSAACTPEQSGEKGKKEEGETTRKEGEGKEGENGDAAEVRPQKEEDQKAEGEKESESQGAPPEIEANDADPAAPPVVVSEGPEQEVEKDGGGQFASLMSHQVPPPLGALPLGKLPPAETDTGREKNEESGLVRPAVRSQQGVQDEMASRTPSVFSASAAFGGTLMDGICVSRAPLCRDLWRPPQPKPEQGQMDEFSSSAAGNEKEKEKGLPTLVASVSGAGGTLATVGGAVSAALPAGADTSSSPLVVPVTQGVVLPFVRRQWLQAIWLPSLMQRWQRLSCISSHLTDLIPALGESLAPATPPCLWHKPLSGPLPIEDCLLQPPRFSPPRPLPDVRLSFVCMLEAALTGGQAQVEEQGYQMVQPLGAAVLRLIALLSHALSDSLVDSTLLRERVRDATKGEALSECGLRVGIPRVSQTTWMSLYLWVPPLLGGSQHMFSAPETVGREKEAEAKRLKEVLTEQKEKEKKKKKKAKQTADQPDIQIPDPAKERDEAHRLAAKVIKESFVSKPSKALIYVKKEALGRHEQLRHIPPRLLADLFEAYAAALYIVGHCDHQKSPSESEKDKGAKGAAQAGKERETMGGFSPASRTLPDEAAGTGWGPVVRLCRLARFAGFGHASVFDHPEREREIEREILSILETTPSLKALTEAGLTQFPRLRDHPSSLVIFPPPQEEAVKQLSDRLHFFTSEGLPILPLGTNPFKSPPSAIKQRAARIIRSAFSERAEAESRLCRASRLQLLGETLWDLLAADEVLLGYAPDLAPPAVATVVQRFLTPRVWLKSIQKTSKKKKKDNKEPPPTSFTDAPVSKHFFPFAATRHDAHLPEGTKEGAVASLFALPVPYFADENNEGLAAAFAQQAALWFGSTSETPGGFWEKMKQEPAEVGRWKAEDGKLVTSIASLQDLRHVMVHSGALVYGFLHAGLPQCDPMDVVRAVFMAADLGNSEREKQELVRRCRVFLEGSPRPDEEPMKTLKETGETRWRLVAGLDAPVPLVELFRQIAGALLLCDGRGVEGVRKWLTPMARDCIARPFFSDVSDTRSLRNPVTAATEIAQRHGIALRTKEWPDKSNVPAQPVPTNPMQRGGKAVAGIQLLDSAVVSPQNKFWCIIYEPTTQIKLGHACGPSARLAKRRAAAEVTTEKVLSIKKLIQEGWKNPNPSSQIQTVTSAAQSVKGEGDQDRENASEKPATAADEKPPAVPTRVGIGRNIAAAAQPLPGGMDFPTNVVRSTAAPKDKPPAGSSIVPPSGPPPGYSPRTSPSQNAATPTHGLDPAAAQGPASAKPHSHPPGRPAYPPHGSTAGPSSLSSPPLPSTSAAHLHAVSDGMEAARNRPPGGPAPSSFVARVNSQGSSQQPHLSDHPPPQYSRRPPPDYMMGGPDSPPPGFEPDFPPSRNQPPSSYYDPYRERGPPPSRNPHYAVGKRNAPYDRPPSLAQHGDASYPSSYSRYPPEGSSNQPPPASSHYGQPGRGYSAGPSYSRPSGASPSPYYDDGSPAYSSSSFPPQRAVPPTSAPNRAPLSGAYGVPPGHRGADPYHHSPHDERGGPPVGAPPPRSASKPWSQAPYGGRDTAPLGPPPPYEACPPSGSTGAVPAATRHRTLPEQPSAGVKASIPSGSPSETDRGSRSATAGGTTGAGTVLGPASFFGGTPGSRDPSLLDPGGAAAQPPKKFPSAIQRDGDPPTPASSSADVQPVRPSSRTAATHPPLSTIASASPSVSSGNRGDREGGWNPLHSDSLSGGGLFGIFGGAERPAVASASSPLPFPPGGALGGGDFSIWGAPPPGFGGDGSGSEPRGGPGPLPGSSRVPFDESSGDDEHLHEHSPRVSLGDDEWDGGFGGRELLERLRDVGAGDDGGNGNGGEGGEILSGFGFDETRLDFLSGGASPEREPEKD